MESSLRIVHMSDLHLELEGPCDVSAAWQSLVQARLAIPGHPQRGPLLADLPGADLVVLAGDIDRGVGGIAYADALARYAGCPVVYVAGNHEYYGHDLLSMRERMRTAAWASDGRVIFLDRDWVRLGRGARELLVLGATLWTDYAVTGAVADAMERAAVLINDHRRIRWDQSGFTPAHALAEHHSDLRWLAETIPHLRAQEPQARLLLVSHHAPCRAGLGWREEDIAPAYVSDLEVQIAQWRPAAWLHGHTHYRHASSIGSTLVASAPRGYWGSGLDSMEYHYGEISMSAGII